MPKLLDRNCSVGVYREVLVAPWQVVRWSVSDHSPAPRNGPREVSICPRCRTCSTVGCVSAYVIVHSYRNPRTCPTKSVVKFPRWPHIGVSKIACGVCRYCPHFYDLHPIEGYICRRKPQIDRHASTCNVCAITCYWRVRRRNIARRWQHRERNVTGKPASARNSDGDRRRGMWHLQKSGVAVCWIDAAPCRASCAGNT